MASIINGTIGQNTAELTNFHSDIRVAFQEFIATD